MARGHHLGHSTGPSGLTHCISGSSTDCCRKVKRRQEAPRWVDAYTVPGQFVGVRYPPDPISDLVDSPLHSTEGAPAPQQQQAHRQFLGLCCLRTAQRLSCT